MHPDLTRPDRKTLRELATMAYARELDAALTDLHAQFMAWQAKRIDGFALSEAIHQFHQGVARELWSRYEHLDPGLVVRLALERGLLRPAEVPAALQKKLGGSGPS